MKFSLKFFEVDFFEIFFLTMKNPHVSIFHNLEFFEKAKKIMGSNIFSGFWFSYYYFGGPVCPLVRS